MKDDEQAGRDWLLIAHAAYRDFRFFRHNAVAFHVATAVYLIGWIILGSVFFAGFVVVFAITAVRSARRAQTARNTYQFAEEQSGGLHAGVCYLFGVRSL